LRQLAGVGCVADASRGRFASEARSAFRGPHAPSVDGTVNARATRAFSPLTARDRAGALVRPVQRRQGIDAKWRERAHDWIGGLARAAASYDVAPDERPTRWAQMSVG
jgi:hypothetical protein